MKEERGMVGYLKVDSATAAAAAEERSQCQFAELVTTLKKDENRRRRTHSLYLVSVRYRAPIVKRIISD